MWRGRRTGSTGAAPPIDYGHVRAVSLNKLGDIRLELVPALLAPYDNPLTTELADRIRDFRFKQCIDSENEAIRRLIEAGLEALVTEHQTS